MSIQNKYKRTPEKPPQKKGSSEVVSQMVNQKEKGEKKATKKATFVLDADLHKQLRTYAAVNDTTMLDVVEKALNTYLKEDM